MVLTGIKTRGNITTYIKRGNIVMSEDGTFETTNHVNAEFIKKRIDQGKTPSGAVPPSVGIKPMSKSVKVKGPDEKPPKKSIIKVKGPEHEQYGGQTSLFLEQKEADLEKKLIDTEIARQKLAVMIGENVPVDLVKMVVSDLSRSMLDNYKAYSEQMLSNLCHKYRIPDKDRANIITKNVSDLNTIHQRAIDKSRAKMKSELGNKDFENMGGNEN